MAVKWQWQCEWLLQIINGSRDGQCGTPQLLQLDSNPFDSSVVVASAILLCVAQL